MIEIPTTTSCVPFEINAPIWNGGNRVVGLNQRRIGEHNEITFTYVRKKDGQKSFPDTYYIAGATIRARNYPTQVVKGITLVLVPFYDLEIMVRVRPQPKFETDPTKMPMAVRQVFFPESIPPPPPPVQADLFSRNQTGQSEPKPVQLKSNSGESPMKEA